MVDDDMAQRMAMTRCGQVTWARPDLGRECVSCVHLADRQNNKVKGVTLEMGRCALVKFHTRKEGVQFKVKGAVACSQYLGT